MFCYSKELPTHNFAEGVVLKILGHAENMNVLHWDMEDGSVVAWHSHPEEQFGYCIAGGFSMRVGDETAELRAGDCYFIPPNVPHEFTAVGKTEAIDVFSPMKPSLPGLDLISPAAE